MGAGKSTISDFLRTVFAMEVVEMDQIIAEREGMSISDIFETYGEEYFRNLETELLIEMQSKSNVVISCGGGVPMRERNVVEMKKNGRVVLLTAKPETILNRVKDNHDRPLLEGNKNVVFHRQTLWKNVVRNIRQQLISLSRQMVRTSSKSVRSLYTDFAHWMQQE